MLPMIIIVWWNVKVFNYNTKANAILEEVVKTIVYVLKYMPLFVELMAKLIVMNAWWDVKESNLIIKVSVDHKMIAYVY